MRQRGTGRGRILKGEPVLLVDENVFDGAIAIGAQPLGAGARRVEAIGAVEPAQAHQSEARAVALLRMRPALQDAGHEPARRGSRLRGPGDEP